MRRIYLSSTLMSTLTLAVFFYAYSSYASVPLFKAPEIQSGKTLSFPEKNAKITVIAFLSAKCPCSAGHEATLKSLYEKFNPKGVAFIGVHANQDENLDQTQTHFKSSALPFPIVQDSGAKIADQLKALKTPHVYVVQNNEIVFQGGVDDSADPSMAKKHFLADALVALDEGKPIAVAQARALGCAIKR